MKINMNKTKILPFNLSTKFDFLPQLNFPEQPPLEVIYETRLLGVTLASNLSWWPHINDITRRATKKLWVLVRFKSLGGSTDQLVQIYQTRVRSTLESGAQVIDPLLSAVQAGEIEAVQQSCLQIVLGTESRSYTSNMASLGITSLASRRKVLVRDFAIACFKSPSHRCGCVVVAVVQESAGS